MLGTHDLPLFLLTAITLILIPGPSTLYILGRTVSQGRRAGVLSVLGIGTGSLCHTVAVAFGLSTLLTASQSAFEFVKCAGACYLIYLGLKALLSESVVGESDLSPPTTGNGRIYAQGLLTQILNPKVTLFFAALMPQFVTPAASHSPLPFLLLGALFVSMDTVWFLLLTNCSAVLSRRLRRSARLQTASTRATGVLYIGLGIHLLRLRARVAH